MAWIKLSEAAQIANVHISNVRRKLKRLRQINPELYNKIVKKEGTEYGVLRREFVAFLNTDLRRLKPSKVRSVRTVRPDKTRRPEAVDPKIKKMAERIVKLPVVLNVEPNVQQIFDSCPNQVEREKMYLAVKICHDYMSGYDTLEICAQSNGIDPRTFHRWRQESPHMMSLFKRAQAKMNKILKDRVRELALGAIHKLINGGEKEHKSYRVVIGYSGKEILILDKVNITRSPPHLGAAIFWLVNQDPENWKRHTPFDELFKDKAKPEDQFDKMSDDELTAYIAKADKALK